MSVNILIKSLAVRLRKSSQNDYTGVEDDGDHNNEINGDNY